MKHISQHAVRFSVLVASFQVLGAGAVAQTVLIGEGVRNGFFSDTGLVSATRANGDQIVDGDSTRLVVNASGRTMLQEGSEVGCAVGIPYWTARRAELNGGNPAFGFDGVPGQGPEGYRSVGRVGYAFLNSGAVDWVSDPVEGPFRAGDRLTLDFGVFGVRGLPECKVTARLTFDSGESHRFVSVGLPQGDNTVAWLSEASQGQNSYTLSRGASSVTVVLESSTHHKIGQLTVDNVLLTTGEGGASSPPPDLASTLPEPE